jgi:hypothetical protein
VYEILLRKTRFIQALLGLSLIQEGGVACVSHSHRNMNRMDRQLRTVLCYYQSSVSLFQEQY